MIGVVLCGGESTRMGKDKGLLREGAYAWAVLAAEKLGCLHIPVVVSVSDSQSASYAAIFTSTPIIKDNPDLLVKGPLAGLLSVHLAFPGEDLFLLACDMPRMQTNILQVLYQIHLQTDAAQAILFINNGQPEPLCAIYSARALVTIAGMHEQRLLMRHSMKYVLEQLEPIYIPVTEDQLPGFANINTIADLNKQVPPGNIA